MKTKKSTTSIVLLAIFALMQIPSAHADESGWVEDENVHEYVMTPLQPSTPQRSKSRSDDRRQKLSAFDYGEPDQNDIDRAQSNPGRTIAPSDKIQPEDPDGDGITFQNLSSSSDSAPSLSRANQGFDPDDDLPDGRSQFRAPLKGSGDLYRATNDIPRVGDKSQDKKSDDSNDEGEKPEGKKNWFLNPPPVPWMNSLGKGIKDTAKGTVKAVGAVGETGAAVLSSPEFWGLVGAGAAVYGAYELNKRNPYYPYNPYLARPGYYPGILPGSLPYGNYNPNVNWVNPYTTSTGTYVPGYYRTAPNGILQDNFGY